MLNPESIAVVGASSNPLKPGGRVFKNIKENGFTGELWPVNPTADDIMGLPAFTSIENLPAAPELALISIPAGGVISAMKDLAGIGTKAVIILTAGFGETGEEGKKAEREILALAEENNMTVIGPNCSGFLTPVYAGKFAGIIPELKPGSIDFVSGSGATVDYVMEQADIRGLKFSHVLNLGNSIQMGVEDMLELLDESHGPDSSKLILLYMEAVNKPQKLLYHVRRLIAKGCTFVGIKSGVTEAGARAAASHTGAMAGSDHAVQALFDKAGIIRVNSKFELIEVTCALVALQTIPENNRACIVTDAGGPGVMLTDELFRQHMDLSTFSTNTIERLQDVLPAQASLVNPIDCLPSRNAEQIQKIFNILGEEESDNIDVVFFLSGNSGMSDNWEIYQEIIQLKKECPIPIIPIFSSATTCADLFDRVKEAGTIFFLDEVLAGRAVGQIINRPRQADHSSTLSNYDHARIDAVMSASEPVLPPDSVEKILAAAGFSLPLQIEVSEAASLKEACRQIGFPVVMKVVGPLHKSDVGGVKIGIDTSLAADSAWRDLMAISNARSVLVQKMVDGPELILGATREAGFGHLIMFGLGGIYTEVLKDVRFSLGPLSTDEALEMIRGVQAYPILEGVRGEAGVSIEMLADYLVRLSRLVDDFPQIREIDINPVKGIGQDLYAVDTRILVGD